jgi:hypothetical protein
VFRRWILNTLGRPVVIPGFFWSGFSFFFFLSLFFSLPTLYIIALPKTKTNYRPITTTALSAEWEKEWKDSNFEGDLAKVQKEAEERLEEKVAELLSNIENTGAN